jgi:hypothetical protein
MFNINLKELAEKLSGVIQLPVQAPSPIMDYVNMSYSEQVKQRKLQMNECCEKSGGKCNCNGEFKNPATIRKEKLQSYLKEYAPRDLRFAYFRSRRHPAVYVTAVSVIDRKTCILKVAFAFASPKDTFCKAEGKLKCFDKLKESNHHHVVQVPWLEDGLLSIYLAYNRMKQKPEKLLLTKFDDLGFIGRN